MASPVITFRPDTEAESALTQLSETGLNRTEIINLALVAAARDFRRQRQREEAVALANNPDDRAEIRQVMRDMEDDGAW